MKYFKVFISIVLLSLTGCMTNTSKEESGVCVVEDEKISINHKNFRYSSFK